MAKASEQELNKFKRQQTHDKLNTLAVELSIQSMNIVEMYSKDDYEFYEGQINYIFKLIDTIKAHMKKQLELIKMYDNI